MLRTAAAAALLSLCLTACSNHEDRSKIGSSSSSKLEKIGKYDQTWPKAYDRTRCSDWLREMSLHQRFVFSAQMLKELREVSDYPDDYDVKRFQRKVGKVCLSSPKQRIVDMAVGVWTSDYVMDG